MNGVEIHRQKWIQISIYFFLIVDFNICICTRNLQPTPPAPKFDLQGPVNNNAKGELGNLFEGDILLSAQDFSRNALRAKNRRWNKGIVPYSILKKDFTQTSIKNIHRAFKIIQGKSCIKYRPYRKSDKRWIQITGKNKGCYSSVGKQNGPGQVVNVSKICQKRIGTILHELLHALGFIHQHSVHNRDSYVKILWNNIQPEHKHNFKKNPKSKTTNYGVKYDYNSIMHYGSKDFSKNGRVTVVSLKPKITIGQRKYLSKGDVTKLNKMYCMAAGKNKSGKKKPKKNKSAKKKPKKNKSRKKKKIKVSSIVDEFCDPSDEEDEFFSCKDILDPILP